MKRGLISLVAALSLVFGAAAAQADWGGGDGWAGQQQSEVAIAGTIVSVNSTAGSFVANAYEAGGGDWGSSGGGRQDDVSRDDDGGGTTATTSAPATTQVTVTTNSSTEFRVNGKTASISDLAAGQKFEARLSGTPGSDITTLVTNNPALSVTASTPPQLYAFVGTVTAVAPASSGGGGTVSVNVTNSLPSGLVSSASNPVTFTVGADTLLLGGSATGGLSGGTLSGVSTGDVVAGGLVAAAGDTLAQIEASPLKLLLDFPAASVTHISRSSASSSALNRAASLLGIKAKAKSKVKTKSTKKTKKSKRR